MGKTIPYNFNELIGRKFNDLLLLREGEQAKSGRKRGVFKCKCGNEKLMLMANIVNLKIKDCGCVRNSNTSKRNFKHGLTYLEEYIVWQGIKARCYNENSEGYIKYGKKGIQMSDEWRNSFEAFYADMGPRPSKYHTVERKNNSLGYCKENCVWATPKEQSRNKTNNIVIEFNGQKKCLAEWVEILGLRYNAIRDRLIKLNWSVERAFTEPVSNLNGRFKSKNKIG